MRRIPVSLSKYSPFSDWSVTLENRRKSFINNMVEAVFARHLTLLGYNLE
jgi:hypothetical protein